MRNGFGVFWIGGGVSWCWASFWWVCVYVCAVFGGTWILGGMGLLCGLIGLHSFRLTFGGVGDKI